MKSFNILHDFYCHLVEDLSSGYISPSASYLAKQYYLFTQSVNYAFTSKDFSNLPPVWKKFEDIFENKPFNFISLGLYIGDMDYSIKKDYLHFLLDCQNFIAQTFFNVFVHDLSLYEKNKQLLPPLICFSQWLDKPYDTIKSYFKDFSQEHFNFLSAYNHLPDFELFIDTLFLRSKKEYDKNSLDYEYFLFHLENLQTLINKNIYADILLKNNQLLLPEDFIDYLKVSVKKLSDKSSQQQSQLEQKELQDFFITYQKQKFDYLFPAKHIKTKINKI